MRRVPSRGLGSAEQALTAMLAVAVLPALPLAHQGAQSRPVTPALLEVPRLASAIRWRVRFADAVAGVGQRLEHLSLRYRLGGEQHALALSHPVEHRCRDAASRAARFAEQLTARGCFRAAVEEELEGSSSGSRLVITPARADCTILSIAMFSDLRDTPYEIGVDIPAFMRGAVVPPAPRMLLCLCGPKQGDFHLGVDVDPEHRHGELRPSLELRLIREEGGQARALCAKSLRTYSDVGAGRTHFGYYGDEGLEQFVADAYVSFRESNVGVTRVAATDAAAIFGSYRHRLPLGMSQPRIIALPTAALTGVHAAGTVVQFSNRDTDLSVGVVLELL